VVTIPPPLVACLIEPWLQIRCEVGDRYLEVNASFAARPGTEVEPMWSMRSARSPSAVCRRRAISSNSATHPRR
jgi:hypothetical protein